MDDSVSSHVSANVLIYLLQSHLFVLSVVGHTLLLAAGKDTLDLPSIQCSIKNECAFVGIFVHTIGLSVGYEPHPVLSCLGFTGQSSSCSDKLHSISLIVSDWQILAGSSE